MSIHLIKPTVVTEIYNSVTIALILSNIFSDPEGLFYI